MGENFNHFYQRISMFKFDRQKISRYVNVPVKYMHKGKYFCLMYKQG